MPAMTTSPTDARSPARLDTATVCRSPALLAATCLGAGLVPKAPGTAGAAIGVLVSMGLAELVSRLAATTQIPDRVAEALLVAAIGAVGIPLCTRAAERIGRGKDPGPVCYDEMAAVPLVLLVVPPAARTAAVLLAAFLLFRLFDIWKPYPIRRVERLPAGLGIMADDWAAAGYAAAALAACRAAGIL